MSRWFPVRSRTSAHLDLPKFIVKSNFWYARMKKILLLLENTLNIPRRLYFGSSMMGAGYSRPFAGSNPWVSRHKLSSENATLLQNCLFWITRVGRAPWKERSDSEVQQYRKIQGKFSQALKKNKRNVEKNKTRKIPGIR